MKVCGKKILLVSICCWQFTTGAFAQGYEDLAAYWAPDVDQLFNPAGNFSQANPAQEDTFTLFNFDLDWRANNNWDNLNYYKLKPPVLYYSVVDTQQFYYVGYYFYYPRHLGANPHGNDFAGLTMAVEKLPDNKQGRLAGILLYDDTGWQGVSTSKLAVDAPVHLTLSAGEHAIALKGKGSSQGNVFICKPPHKATAQGEVVYNMVSLDELWRHREEISASEAYGIVDNEAGKDLKNLPWKWHYKGIPWLADPAGLFRAITTHKELSGNYLYNPYVK